MFSEVSGERFVCRTRAGPLCPSVWSKIHLCGHHEKRRNNDFDGVCSCLWCVVKEDHMSLLPWMWSHRSWMTTKSQNLNISVFRHQSPWGLETPGQTRLQCVFVVLRRWAHTLTCIVTGLHLQVCTCRCMSNVRSSCFPCIVKPFRKTWRKSFVIHLFARSTVRCSLLTLRMSCSEVVDTHKS